MPALEVRRAAAVLGSIVVLAAATACTGDPDANPWGAGGRAAGPSQTVAPSAPQEVEVTRVAGRLTARQRRALADQVRPTITAYVDAAFLGGSYPRADFSGSFGAFTSGAVAEARRDQDLLTNRRLGPTTRSVRAARRTAYLSVLAPRGMVTGLTAAVNLVFVVDRRDGPAERVRLAGRLLLTRERSGRWAIFGYDLNRAETPVRGVS